MTFYEFASRSPFLTFFLVFITLSFFLKLTRVIMGTPEEKKDSSPSGDDSDDDND